MSVDVSSRREPVAEQAAGHHRRKAFSAFMRQLARLKSTHHHHHHHSHQGHPSPASGGYLNNSKSRRNGQANNYTSSLRKSNSGSNTSWRSTGKHRSNSQPSLPSTATEYYHDSALPDISQDKQHTSLSASSSGSNKDNPNKPKPSNQTITTTTTSIHSPSAWSSPAPSVRSLTTTLTTITTTAPLLSYNPHPSHHHNPNGPPILYSNPLPSVSQPQPSSQNSGQVYYSTAVANGLLTDNASIITLASSSKRRRRHSFDTDASIRALPPASLWGGSRESLPLSVLSSNLENRVPGERGSLYSRLGGDTSSVRGMNSPGFTGPASVGNDGYFFPPATPKEHSTTNRESMGTGPPGFRSRRSSAWGELHHQGWDDDGDNDSRSMGSARTASIRSGRTGREELSLGRGGNSLEESTGSSDSTQHPIKRNSAPLLPICLNGRQE